METQRFKYIVSVTAVLLLYTVGVSGQTAPVFNVFNPNPVTLHEDTSVETSLVQVECSDPVDGDECLCNILSTTPANAPFEVFKKTVSSPFVVYYLGTANFNALDFAVTTTYLLTVTCDDTKGDNSTEQVLEVDIEQNQAPTITNTDYPNKFITLDAGTPVTAGEVVMTVTASDPESDTLEYSIVTSPSVTYFTMSLNTGVLSTAEDLRLATEGSVLVTVSVTDNKGNTVNDFEIFVTIDNLNTRPEITNLPQTIYINEDAVSGDTIVRLTVTDPDQYVAQMTPTCTVNPVSEQYKFTVDVGSNLLRLSTLPTGSVPLDYERINLYYITCVVNDGYLDSTNDLVTLNIVNVNDAPEFSDIAYYCYLDEADVGLSSCSTGATITDPESDTITSISFVSGNNSNRFRFDRTTSQVTFNVDYNVDNNAMPTSVTLQLQAVDVHGASSSVPVYITVRDVNDNTCDFVNTVETFALTDGQTLGTLGSFTFTDSDLTSPNKDVTIEVVSASPSDSTNYLAVYSDGTITYTQLIPEANHGNSYTITVRCKDGGSPQLTAEGTVVVSYMTTTTSTTTTTTTTTNPSSDPFDDESFVALFSIFMVFLGLGLLVALFFLYKLCCGAGNVCGPGCQKFCCPQKQPPTKVEPLRNNYFNNEVRTNRDYKDSHWKNGDNFESGGGDGRGGDGLGPDRSYVRTPPSLRDPLHGFF